MFNLAELGVSGINHFGLATNNLDASLKDLLQIPGSRLLRGPGENQTQKVRFAFVDTGRGVIELLEPIGHDSPIKRLVATGGGVYHICFEVDSIDILHDELSKSEGNWVVSPTPDPAFDGRRIAFLMDKNLGLIEFVESRPTFTVQPEKLLDDSELNKRADASQPRALSLDDTYTKVLRLVAGILQVDESEINQESGIGSIEQWDSLASLQIISQVESVFNLKIPALEIGNLVTLRSIVSYVQKAGL
jgi:acyl carrier protein